MQRKNTWGLWAGILLVFFGALFLLGEFLRVDMMKYLWPFFILAIGGGFFVGMLAGGRSLGALAVPGSVIVTVGLILFFQNLFGLWATWAYAWALIIAGAGVGLMIFGSRSDLPELRRAGRVVIGVGLVTFVGLGMLFELSASLLGWGSLGGFFWPAALILMGLYVLFGRSFFDQLSGPARRSTVNFEPPATGEPVGQPPAAAFSQAQAEGVRRLNFRALGDMTILQGEREGLEIDASDVVKERIHTEMQGNTLEIRYEQDWLDWLNPRFWNISPIRYTLYVRSLEAINAAGLGNLVAPNLATDCLEVTLSGTGNITFHQLQAQSLSVHQAGLGNVSVAGKVERQEVQLTGTGSYQAAKLESRTADVRLTGLGSATVNVADTLDATVSGLGSIEYLGSPRLSQTVSGLGSVRHI